MIATVSRINWTAGTIDAMTTFGEPINDVLYVGFPPPPLTSVEIATDRQGRLVLRGSYAATERIIYDDFLHYDQATYHGDTPWKPRFTVGGTAAITGEGMGVMDIATVGSGNAWSLTKTDSCCALPQDGGALWVSISARMFSNTPRQWYGGLLNPDAGSHVVAIYRTTRDAVYLYGQCRANGGAENPVGPIGTPLTFSKAEGFFIVDMVWAPGVFAAWWYNGDGPYFTRTNVPTVAMQPEMKILCLSNTAGDKAPNDRHAYHDFYRLWRVRSGVQPPESVISSLVMK